MQLLGVQSHKQQVAPILWSEMMMSLQKKSLQQDDTIKGALVELQTVEKKVENMLEI